MNGFFGQGVPGEGARLPEAPLAPRPDRAVVRFFGAPDGPLLGAFHEPAAPAAAPGSVVLCYPMGREYIFAHRAFRQLAVRLARDGLPVLRFDYFGTGDSAGSAEEADLDRWMLDVEAAMAEAQARSGVPCRGLAGFRIGASLAALVSASRAPLDWLVLWDPVIDGAAYVDMLRESHRRWRRANAHGLAAAEPMPGTAEVLGFPLGSDLETRLRGVDLMALDRAPARQVLLLSTGPDAPPSALASRLTALGSSVETAQASWPEFWAGSEALQDVLVPPSRVLDVIRGWLGRVAGRSTP